MYKCIILCLCINLSGVLCDLDKAEGAACEWDGVNGTCVAETRCLTTLERTDPKHPVCSKQGEVTIICCTDCELVNDTRNVVFSPSGGMLWKDGSPARDHCLEYLDKLPYECRQGGFYGGLKRYLDDEEKCHTYHLWAVGGSPPPGHVPAAEFPHTVLLGYGDTLETAKWLATGSIISDRYVLTSASSASGNKTDSVPKFVALDIQNFSDSSAWQTHKVKRIILHPNYTRISYFNDIALIETETPVKYNKNVLPACLHVEGDEYHEAVATTWKNLELIYDNDFTVQKPIPEYIDTINTIKLVKFSENECKKDFAAKLQRGVDYASQLCYGSHNWPHEAKRVMPGGSLLINTQISYCINTVIGVATFWRSEPNIYTKVIRYVPWIESVVWP